MNTTNIKLKISYTLSPLRLPIHDQNAICRLAFYSDIADTLITIALSILSNSTRLLFDVSDYK